MTNPMLPNSEAGVPKTNADRMPQPAAQPASYGLMPGEDKEDEPGEEMARDARVWKTYVREADTFDKDMVDGRNSSLDVLLIFAALFSAISTTFIIDSLGDLKQDPADSSAQTLQAILQTQQAMLQAIVAGPGSQTITSSPQTQSDPAADFSPSHAAVAVNVLWLLSLALSVGVSLVAMLAKGWCYQYMSGRNGPLYEQGRRRQMKWEGIKEWKMQEVLACLPYAMHVALCYRYCPYSTPMTAALLWCLTHPALWQAAHSHYRDAPIDSWSKSIWLCMRDWIGSHTFTNTERSASESKAAHMDETTARMLAWLVETCDDWRSVDVALQALAGASPTLPCSPLLSCSAHWLLSSRIRECNNRGVSTGQVDSKSTAIVVAELRLLRAYAALFTDDLEKHLDSPTALDISHRAYLTYEFRAVVESYGRYVMFARNVRLADTLTCSRLPNFIRVFQSSVGAMENDVKSVPLTAASYIRLIARTKQLQTLRDEDRTYMDNHSWHRDITVQPTMQALERYNGVDTPPDEATAYRMLIGMGYHLACCDLSESQKQGELYKSLVRLCVVLDSASTVVPRTSALILAVAAFTLCTYPGGEQPTQNDAAGRSKRALQVLEYYQRNRPDELEAACLFAFGLVAVLVHLPVGTAGWLGEARIGLLRMLLDGVCMLSFYNTVHTLRGGFDSHIGQPIALVTEEQAESHKATKPRSWLGTVQDTLSLDLSDPYLYVPALAALRSTRSGELQELCVGILDSQLATLDVAQLIAGLQKYYYLYRVTQLEDADTSVRDCALFYFRLLVTAIMLCPTISTSERTDALQRLKDQGSDYLALEASSDSGSSVTWQHVVDHLSQATDQQSASDCMRGTMQLIADFCHACGTSTSLQKGNPDWTAKLHQVRCRRQPVAQGADTAHQLNRENAQLDGSNTKIQPEHPEAEESQQEEQIINDVNTS